MKEIMKTFYRFILLQICTLMVQAYDNGLGLTPPMGWNTWNKFHCNIDEELIKATARSVVDLGLHKFGYKYINLDDCWQESRNSTGFIVEATDRFPSGMGALSDYIHGLGLKFGLYSDSGLLTCQKKPGGTRLMKHVL